MKLPKGGLLLDIGHGMRTFRQKKKMTQGDIVRATGLERAYVSRLEGNKIPYPRIETVLKITKALGVTIEQFIHACLDGGKRENK